MKKMILAFLFTSTFLMGSQMDVLPEPYSSLKTVLPFNPQGWYSNARRIEELIDVNKVEVAVEVGSWLGASTRHIASLLPSKGRIYAVDHWEGSPELQNHELLPTVYEQFLSNVIHAKLTDKIIPLKMESIKAAEYLAGTRIDLVYLDGAHDTESVLKDLEAWFPYVKGHGVICGDDWTWPTVEKAVRYFAKKNNLRVEHKKCFWRLIENKKSLWTRLLDSCSKKNTESSS